ncbi:protein jag [bacterium]|nr:protein jag [bacterium]
MVDYEFEGKTTEEAMENASRELELPVEELTFDILEPGSAGIFGLVGGKKAKIKVTVESQAEAVQAEDAQAEDAQAEDAQVEDAQAEDAQVEAVDEKGLDLARESLQKILELIPMDTIVHAEQIDGKIALDIEGDKSGLLIGRRGKTLDALQYIVNKIVNKALDQRAHVVVDSENYRKRRKESLTQLAQKMGDKAKRTKKSVTTNLLNPHDRRIVHLALKEDDRLDTRSRGDGLLKKIVIIPKK